MHLFLESWNASAFSNYKIMLRCLQLAVTGLNKCKDYFLKLLVDMCVLLEGQESSELPERVLMCVRLCYPDFKNVKCHIDDVTSSDSTACNE